MKRKLLCCAALVALCCGLSVARESKVVVGEGDAAKTYELAKAEDAKAYVEAYADNVQADPEFKSHEAQALKTVRETEPLFGTWWAILPPLLAIVLALVTKEVYSSLFLGIVSGGVLYAFKADGFVGMFETAITHVVQAGFIAKVADAYNVGILIFLVLLGALVAMMNKTGASAAFGRWAQTHIRSRVGAQIATIVLGMLIFVDDYFNCLTVGSVMHPVTKAKKVSAAKLSYLIDATAAPICIIAPISSWAAAVAGFAKGAGAESGFSLFIAAIPYNFYAILTLVTMFALVLMKFDFGPMRRHEEAVSAGLPDLGALEEATAVLTKNDRGRVMDLVIPVLVLIAACVVGMIYSGGFFAEGEAFHNFMVAFSNSDASVGLTLGSIVALVFAVVFYVCRRVISFRDCMDGFPEGFKAMVPAIMILCCAWTLKGMTDALGAKVFISDLINGPAAGLYNFLPAIIFVIAVILAFSTGTSWGTFGILIPIVLAAIPGSSMTIVAVSACMAGAVCGDHCSPISDTTIMASAGAQCNHIAHVNTQLPYALLVAAVSFVAYVVAPFVGSPWIALSVAVVLMLATLFCLRFRAISALCLLLLVLGCGREETPTLKMVTEPTFPPYEFLRGRKVVGVDVEICRAVAAKLGKELEVVSVDFDAILPSLLSGKADLAAAGLTVTEDRRKNVDFSVPYMRTGLVIISRKVKPFSDMTAARGKRVGVQSGTTGDEYVVRELKQEPERFRSYPEAVSALKAGRCDLVLCDAILAKNCIVGEPEMALSDFVTSEEYAIAVPKGNSALLAAVNETISELKASGKMDAWVASFTVEAEKLKEK